MRRFVPRGSAARYAPTAPPPAPSPPPPSRSSGYRRGRVHQDDATPAAPAAPDAPPPPPAFQSRSRSRTSPTSPSTAPLVTPVASGRRRPEQVEPTAAGRRDPSSGRRRPSSDGGDARGGRSYSPEADSSQTQQQQQPPPPPPLPSPTYRRREGGPTRDSRAREEAATPPPVHAAAGYRPRSRPRNSGLSVVPVTIPPPPSVVTEEAVGGFRPRPEGAASRRRPTPASSPQQDLRQYKATPLEVATSLHPVPPSASAGAPDAKQGAPTGRGFHRFRPQSKENSEERRPDSAHAQVDESDNYPPEFKERINSNAPTKLTRLPSFPSRSRATPLPQDSSNEPKLTTKLRPALSSSIRGPTELRHRLKPVRNH
ncbi:hypothetical protein ONE63_005787 [Megalurothrips usitatus]|uniref:Serine/arginine repetitive matrix protein 1-like n=1 Tax=Megalurothrips usitatus TaxID=439358 RepID=A0AAV7Y0I4_9NEOP|nr:hypothetical protein ONE63_005787 [Megalurothrips usitatus]